MALTFRGQAPASASEVLATRSFAATLRTKETTRPPRLAPLKSPPRRRPFAPAEGALVPYRKYDVNSFRQNNSMVSIFQVSQAPAKRMEASPPLGGFFYTDSRSPSIRNMCHFGR